MPKVGIVMGSDIRYESNGKSCDMLESLESIMR